MSGRELFDACRAFAPELGLTVLILVVILVDLLFKGKAVAARVAFWGLVGILALTIHDYKVIAPAQVLFGGSVVLDAYALFFKALFLAVTLVVIVFAAPGVKSWNGGQGELWTLMLSCTLGLCLMASANDLLMMYLALEFVSITSYILAGVLRKNRKSAEASLKYILYGSAASGLMIYGISFLYGLTGTLEISEVGRRLAAIPDLPSTMTLVVSTLVLAGFGYKIAAVPFHLWCPDVYEGAPTPVTAFFSVGPKAAGFAMLIRFLAGVFQTGTGAVAVFEWRVVLALMAVLTLVVGNFGALHQQNLKRLMAYSSIGHAGIMLLAFAVFNVDNVAAVMFYTAVYAIMNLGAFLVVIILEGFGIETVDQCRGLGWRSPFIGGLTVVFLLALTGLPPTAGFYGKLLIFGFMVEKGGGFEVGLAIIGVLFSVVSLFYYARIMAAMYLAKPKEGEEGPLVVPAVRSVLLAGLAAATLWYGIMPGRLTQSTMRSARTMSPPVGR